MILLSHSWKVMLFPYTRALQMIQKEIIFSIFGLLIVLFCMEDTIHVHADEL